MTDRASLTALRNMIAEVETLISTTVPLPENRTARFVNHERSDSEKRGDQYTFIALEERSKLVLG